jgi:hypothetical protein
VQTLVAEILAAWRRADRLTSDYAPGTLEHAAAMAASERHATSALAHHDNVVSGRQSRGEEG